MDDIDIEAILKEGEKIATEKNEELEAKIKNFTEKAM